MRIGIVTTWFARGAAYVSRQYESALQSAGHAVFIYARGGERSSRGDSEWDKPNVTYAAPALIDTPSAVDIADFRKWITNHHLDLVLFNEQPWWQPVAECIRLGVRTACYVVEYTEKEIPLFGAYDILICHTKQHYRTFESHPGAVYVAWGTDVDYFRPNCRTPLPDHTSFIHAAGSNPNRKGTDVVVEATAKLWYSGVRNFNVLIRSQIPIWKHIPPIARELIYEEVLSYEEGTFDRREVYTKGDVLLYPSRFDGLGLSICEALACGLPVITTDVAPINEFVSKRDGSVITYTDPKITKRSCYPVVEPNAGSLAESMRSWIPFRSELRQAARESAVTNWNWQHNSTALVAAFEGFQASPKEEYGEMIEVHESSKRTSLRSRIGHHAPSLIRYSRIVYRALAGERAQSNALSS